ncbi:hypothetical protein AGMMS50276_09100 [Synergistales bacterium]|nr:hypothetical protein AGMMS50276_09100 [Synergistales bacterium]
MTDKQFRLSDINSAKSTLPLFTRSEFRCIMNTEHRTQNTEHRTQNTEHRTQT